MEEKNHPRYTKEELREAFYIVASLSEQIESGDITEKEFKSVLRYGGIEEVTDAIEVVGKLLEFYGA